MKTSYKGYEIDNCTGDRFIVRLNGKHVTTIQGSLSCVHFAIDSSYEDMTPQPVDTYQDLDLDQAEGEPTNEELNEAEGVKFCSFTAAVEANTKDTSLPVKEKVYTESQMHAFYAEELHKAYNAGYEQGAHVAANDIMSNL
jgi:hypothetical protein